MSAGMWSWPCFLLPVIWMLLFALPLHTGKGAVSHPLNICYLYFCDIVKWKNRLESCNCLSMGCIRFCNRYHLVGSSLGVDQSLLRSSTARCAVEVLYWEATWSVEPTLALLHHLKVTETTLPWNLLRKMRVITVPSNIFKKRGKEGHCTQYLQGHQPHPSAITSINMIAIDNVPFTSELP